MFSEDALIALLKRFAKQSGARCSIARFQEIIREANRLGEERGANAALAFLFDGIQARGIAGKHSGDFSAVVYALASQDLPVDPATTEPLDLASLRAAHTAEGLTILVGAASPGGLSAKRARRLDEFVECTVATWRAAGAEVIPPVRHAAGSTLCVTERAFDLLNLIAVAPTTRGGHQVHAAKTIVAPVLPLVETGASPHCLLDPDGRIILDPVTVDDPAGIPPALDAALPRITPVARRTQRRREELRDAYQPLMRRFGRLTQDEAVVPGLPLSLLSAQEASVDPHANASLSIEQIQQALIAAGETPLDLEDPVDDLTRDQRRAFERVAQEMRPEERLAVVRMARKRMMAAADLTASRRRPEDWSDAESWHAVLREVRPGRAK